MANIKNLIRILLGVFVLSTGVVIASTQQEIDDVKEAAAREFDDANALNYIDYVLDDGILDDPEGYLEAWAIARGNTREYRFPEDAVHCFFISYFDSEE